MSDVALQSMQILSDALARDVLSMRPVPLAWHGEGRDAWGVAYPELRRISLRRDAEYLRRHEQAALLVHELAHCATANEPEHHGERWERLMRRCGIEPRRGDAIVRGGPLWAWLRARGL
jgi:SprT-like family protein